MSGVPTEMFSSPTQGPAGRCGTGNAAGRAAWLRRTLAALPRGQRILDAGAGELRYKPLCAHLDYVSQDLRRYDGHGDGRGLHDGVWGRTPVDIECDITDIPQPDASFDAVMCVEVLEHVPEPIRALRELVRLLRPGGLLILTAPFCALTHQSPSFFHTGFSRYFYEYWLPALGVQIVELACNGNYFEFIGQELNRLSSVAEKYIGAPLAPGERKAVAAVLDVLDRLSANDSHSQELLAYGLHVRGIKQ